MKIQPARAHFLVLAFSGVMAAALQDPQSAAKLPFFNVVSYGARNDASVRSTSAIRAAIQACAKAGGGTVYFPAGVYETGAIELVSNLVLEIDAGATHRLHTDLAEYPVLPGRLEGT